MGWVAQMKRKFWPCWLIGVLVFVAPRPGLAEDGDWVLRAASDAAPSMTLAYRLTAAKDDGPVFMTCRPESSRVYFFVFLNGTDQYGMRLSADVRSANNVLLPGEVSIDAATRRPIFVAELTPRSNLFRFVLRGGGTVRLKVGRETVELPNVTREGDIDAFLTECRGQAARNAAD